MENQAILALVERIVNAPNNDARVKELMNFAPEALLHRAGLTHRSSLLESTLSYTGAMTVGMFMGASAALMLVPGARSELRARFRKSLDRLDHDEKPSSGLSREGKQQPNHIDTKAESHPQRDPSTSMTGRSDGKSIVSAPNHG